MDRKRQGQDSSDSNADDKNRKDSAMQKRVSSSDGTGSGSRSTSTKPRVADLTPLELAKRRQENRKHAAASRARHRETYEKLVIQLSDLQQEVRDERNMHGLLRDRLLRAWQTQRTLLQAIGITPFPLPSALESPIPQPSAASASTGQFPPVAAAFPPAAARLPEHARDPGSE